MTHLLRSWWQNRDPDLGIADPQKSDLDVWLKVLQFFKWTSKGLSMLLRWQYTRLSKESGKQPKVGQSRDETKVVQKRMDFINIIYI